VHIFVGKFRSTVRAPNQPDTVTIEDWRSLRLDIQVRFPFHITRTYLLVIDVEILQKHDSVSTIEDALSRISHLQPVQLGPSGFSEASQQVLIEVLPPVLVLHLKRFLYDVDADSIVKISKQIQFGPELEIPLGTIFSLRFPHASQG
jgi:ubiquitin carboxyl-terminal hydrolase 10